MRICISQLPQRLEVRARHDGASADRHESVVPLRHPDEAQSYLRRNCTRPSAIGELRQLAAEGRQNASALSDEEVLAAIGRQLANGRLILVSGASTPPATGGGTDAAAVPQPSAPPRRPPTMAPSSVLPPPRPAPVPSPVAAAPEEFADVEQDSQAATLEQAADSGVPFCEVCEKAKAEAREKATAGAETTA